MICGKCDRTNDADAAFCANCGQPLSDVPGKVASGPRRSYWYALLLVPVLLAVLGIGYYLFLLPSGVAAVVNGEEITLSELDAAAGVSDDGRGVPAEQIGAIRYAALSQLITERIACQEARKAGIRVSADEVSDAVACLRSGSGLDERGFEAQMIGQYGSMAAFRKTLVRRLEIRKLIDGQIVAGTADPAVANARVNQWLREITGKASVRVALAEGVASAGCSCCGDSGNGPAQREGGSPAGPGAQRGCGMRQGTPAAGQQTQVQAAREAALEYWRRQHGNGPVEMRVTDFGCHIQVDILKDSRIARSLRYQNGVITEI